jgi:hypothetical protein
VPDLLASAKNVEKSCHKLRTVYPGTRRTVGMALETLDTMVGTGGLLSKGAPGVSDPTTYYVKGYYAIGDGGGGVYNWNTDSQEQPNAGSVVAAWGTGPYPTSGRWLLKHDGVVNVRQFGAKGANSTETLTSQGTSRWVSDAHIKATYPSKVGGPFRNNVPNDTVDWAAIQAALVWAGPKGVRVEVQSGIYVCSAPVWLADDSLEPTLGKTRRPRA